jgi:hypothetical protein
MKDLIDGSRRQAIRLSLSPVSRAIWDFQRVRYSSRYESSLILFISMRYLLTTLVSRKSIRAFHPVGGSQLERIGSNLRNLKLAKDPPSAAQHPLSLVVTKTGLDPPDDPPAFACHAH